MAKKVHYLGMRPSDDLVHIPPNYWPHHEYCFYLHDKVADLLIEYEAAGAHRWIAETIARVAAEEGVEGDVDVLDILKKTGMTETGKHVMLGHLTLALTADLLNFLYEGLCCLEKRKFSVAEIAP